MELAAEYEDILKGGLPLSDIRTEGGGGTEMQHIQSEGEGVKKSQNSVDVTYGGPIGRQPPRCAEARLHQTEPPLVRLRRRGRLHPGGRRAHLRVGVENIAAIQVCVDPESLGLSCNNYRVVPSALGLGCIDLNIECSTVCLNLPGLMGIWQKRLGKMVENPNQSQPNPGPRPDGTLCSNP